MDRLALNIYFEEAIKGNWRMTWQAWKHLILHFCGWGVLDNDSGFTDADVIDATQAKRGFFACTVGPAKHFLAA
jgi:hypothetical protein